MHFYISRAQAEMPADLTGFLPSVFRGAASSGTVFAGGIHRAQGNEGKDSLSPGFTI
jgi:hypothetical protein